MNRYSDIAMARSKLTWNMRTRPRLQAKLPQKCGSQLLLSAGIIAFELALYAIGNYLKYGIWRI